MISAHVDHWTFHYKDLVLTSVPRMSGICRYIPGNIPVYTPYIPKKERDLGGVFYIPYYISHLNHLATLEKD